MPDTSRSRTLAAPVDELWRVVRDPHHLPRWWPRVERVEAVEERAFTEVMRTKKGKVVRADFDVLACDEHRHTLTWAQRIAGTPFARVLSAAETELRLRATSTATEVTIELRQTMAGYSRSGAMFGFWPGAGARMVTRAAAHTLEEALDGLERIGA